jgi:hypothetical protein
VQVPSALGNSPFFERKQKGASDPLPLAVSGYGDEVEVAVLRLHVANCHPNGFAIDNRQQSHDLFSSRVDAHNPQQVESVGLVSETVVDNGLRLQKIVETNCHD